MQISVVILGVYGILFFMSRKIKLEQHYRKWEIPFYKLTVFLKKKAGEKQKGITENNNYNLFGQPIGLHGKSTRQER